MAGIGLSILLSILVFALGIAPAAAAPKAEAWSFWAANDPTGKVRVDHAPWGRFLSKYVVTDHPSGINRLRYAAVKPEDRILECAVEGNAEAIVTGDKAMLAIGEYEGIRLVTLADYLKKPRRGGKGGEG